MIAVTNNQEIIRPNSSIDKTDLNTKEIFDPRNALTYYKAIKIAQDCAADSDCHGHNSQLEELRTFFLKMHLKHFTIPTED